MAWLRKESQEEEEVEPTSRDSDSGGGRGGSETQGWLRRRCPGRDDARHSDTIMQAPMVHCELWLLSSQARYPRTHSDDLLMFHGRAIRPFSANDGCNPAAVPVDSLFFRGGRLISIDGGIFARSNSGLGGPSFLGRPSSDSSSTSNRSFRGNSFSASVRSVPPCSPPRSAVTL